MTPGCWPLILCLSIEIMNAHGPVLVIYCHRVYYFSMPSIHVYIGFEPGHSLLIVVKTKKDNSCTNSFWKHVTLALVEKAKREMQSETRKELSDKVED